MTVTFRIKNAGFYCRGIFDSGELRDFVVVKRQGGKTYRRTEKMNTKDKLKVTITGRANQYNIRPLIESESAKFEAWLKINDPDLLAQSQREDLNLRELAATLKRVMASYRKFQSIRDRG